MSGISRSATSDVTTRPSAAPVITPTASASAFCLSRNSRNSRHISPPEGGDYMSDRAGEAGLLRLCRDDAGSGRRLVARKLTKHFGAQREDEGEPVVALHPADRNADQIAAL